MRKTVRGGFFSHTVRGVGQGLRVCHQVLCAARAVRSSPLRARGGVELVMDDEGAVEEPEYEKEGNDHGGEQAEYEEST
ncbi:hypothetical protein [Occallatibacter savannae]|uniref:hypothetical protein n=1 Tax=Occallatibacter savannae TaxID=1002691 RepID=UPI0013A590A3|nr:hypothetical protein [Occallatibacter savannae]